MLKISDLSVGNYMTAFPLSVLSEVSISETVGFMARHGIGNIVISDDDETPLGIFTERELLSLLDTHKSLPDIPLSEVKLAKFEKITPNASVYEAAKTMLAKKSRLLVFSEHDKPVGIITTSDLLRAFRKTDYAPSLSRVISTKVFQCSYDDKISDAVKLMHDKRVGSVLIEKPEENWGLFTERDLIFKVLNNRVPLTEKLKLYSSFPLITTNHIVLANEAASIMAAKNIKRLVLTKNDDIMGIVTARDVVDAYFRYVKDILSAE